MEQIILQSSDLVEFSVDLKVANLSTLIKEMLENLGYGEGGDKEIIPLANVDGATLALVVEWANYHKDDAPTPQEDERDESENKRTDNICSWDANFMKQAQEAEPDLQTVYKIIMAANYLDIKPLLDLVSKTIANMVHGKSVQELRTTFNIVNDFTKEEEDQVNKENEWCEEK